MDFTENSDLKKSEESNGILPPRKPAPGTTSSSIEEQKSSEKTPLKPTKLSYSSVFFSYFVSFYFIFFPYLAEILSSRKPGCIITPLFCRKWKIVKKISSKIIQLFSFFVLLQYRFHPTLFSFSILLRFLCRGNLDTLLLVFSIRK